MHVHARTQVNNKTHGLTLMVYQVSIYIFRAVTVLIKKDTYAHARTHVDDAHRYHSYIPWPIRNHPTKYQGNSPVTF